MDTREQSIKILLEQQKSTTIALEKKLEELNENDVVKQNKQFQIEIENLTQQRKELYEELRQVTDEKQKYKSSLYQQVYDDKKRMLKNSREQADLLFQTEIGHQLNRLQELEQTIQGKIKKLAEQIARENDQLKIKYQSELTKLQIAFETDVVNLKTKAAQQDYTNHGNDDKNYKELENTPLTEEQIVQMAKKNNIEHFVGLNLVNKIGLFLIIIGVIAVSRFAFQHFTEILKAILIFLFGGGLLGVGEWVNRKKETVFSIGLTAAGISILYIGLGTSFFSYNILSFPLAILLCLLITAVAFFLSVRYHSQTISIFALLGGYLPLLALSTNPALIVGMMVYFVILNLFVLLLSFPNRWKITSFVGLFLHTVASAILILSDTARLPGGGAVLIAYLLVSFMIYNLVPLAHHYKDQSKFSSSGVVFLACNTFLSAFMTYFAFDLLHLTPYMGMLTIGFALVYMALAYLVKKQFSEDTKIQSLFYLTALAFLVLVVPFQFGTHWLSMGWLIEGTLLAVYGILNQDKFFQKCGYLIFSFCLAAFLVVDVLGNVFITSSYFFLKYTSITLGSVAILIAHLYQGKTHASGYQVYNVVTVLNVWIYGIFLIFHMMEWLAGTVSVTSCATIGATGGILWTYVFAGILFTLPTLKDLFGMLPMAITLSIVGLIAPYPLIAFIGNTQGVGNTILILALIFISMYVLSYVLKRNNQRSTLPAYIFPFVLGLYFVILISFSLRVYMNFLFSNMIYSVLYAGIAIVWIVYGFKKHNSFMRRMGLVLILASVVKLFVLDLSRLTEGYRIVSYFVMGIALVLISYFYQRFDKIFEQQQERQELDEKD